MTRGQVYFIECAGRIKIGYSADVKSRLKDLSTAAAHDLTLVASVDGSMEFERAIHKHLKPYRSRGEWFTDCAEVRSAIAGILSAGPASIGYHDVPRAKITKRPIKAAPPVAPLGPSTSALKGVYARLNACMDRYIGDNVAEANEREKGLGLPTGTLINPMIGGYFSPDRWKIACRMIEGTIDQLGDLTHLLFRSACAAAPIETRLLKARAAEFIQELEQSLQALFSERDIAINNLGSFRPLNSDQANEDRRKVKLRSHFGVFGAPEAFEIFSTQVGPEVHLGFDPPQG